MSISIKKHQNLILKQIKSINNSDQDKSLVIKKLEGLERLNRSVTMNFQHERQIHLLVTLFFGLIAIIFAILVFILGYITSNNPSFQTVFSLSVIILTILLTTEVFYVIHYFKLENGTQSLYILSYDIYRSIDSQFDSDFLALEQKTLKHHNSF